MFGELLEIELYNWFLIYGVCGLSNSISSSW